MFVFLDHVSFPQTSRGTYVNRVKIRNGISSTWLTAPIKRSGQDLQSIKDICLSEDRSWKHKTEKRLIHCYGRAPYFKEVRDIIFNLIHADLNFLSQFNQSVIMQLSQLLETDDQTKFVKSSDLNLSQSSTELLVEIVKAVGGSTYVCGGGAKGYQDDSLFAKNRITLEYQNFSHPEYLQFGDEFLPGLSVIDALMHLGIDGTKKLLVRD